MTSLLLRQAADTMGRYTTLSPQWLCSSGLDSANKISSFRCCSRSTCRCSSGMYFKTREMVSGMLRFFFLCVIDRSKLALGRIRNRTTGSEEVHFDPTRGVGPEAKRRGRWSSSSGRARRRCDTASWWNLWSPWRWGYSSGVRPGQRSPVLAEGKRSQGIDKPRLFPLRCNIRSDPRSGDPELPCLPVATPWWWWRSGRSRRWEQLGGRRRWPF